jgi:hypothetical protein
MILEGKRVPLMISFISTLASFIILHTYASLQKVDPDTNVIIDGFNLNTFAYDIKNARVQSNLFNISVPADSILGISPQNVSGIAAGNWVFLKPGALQSGNHKVSFTGKLNGIKSDVSYSLDITDSYNTACNNE